MSEGLVDEGWLDTVLVMPGETVTIFKRTSRYPGWFLYHCHILEHEDMGMMRNLLLVKPCPAGNTPADAPAPPPPRFARDLPHSLRSRGRG